MRQIAFGRLKCLETKSGTIIGLDNLNEVTDY